MRLTYFFFWGGGVVYPSTVALNIAHGLSMLHLVDIMFMYDTAQGIYSNLLSHSTIGCATLQSQVAVYSLY